MDLTDAFGRKGDVPTLALPASREAEAFVLGGIFLNDRNVGSVWTMPDAALKDVLKRDTGLDITPRAGQEGSSGYVPATASPPAQQ
jgi:hypothetical protein